MDLLNVLGLAAISGAGATAGAGALFIWERRTNSVVPLLISFATGTLLAGACLGLLPQALARASANDTLAILLLGILGFAVSERLLVWRHCHEPGCNIHAASGYLILVGDALHNFMDGIAIGAAYLVSPALGVSSAIAVAAHEIPQEVGDFGILLNGGFGRTKALTYNVLSATTAIPGAAVAYFAFAAVEGWLHVVLAVSAASFVYIALADLVPHVREEMRGLRLLSQLALLFLGVGLIWSIRLATT
jgi:zinc and cadmium transporter